MSRPVKLEPVAWRYAESDTEWGFTDERAKADRLAEIVPVEPLYLAPPRSDEANVVKAGDTVRVLRARNAYGQDVYDFGSKPFAAGETFVVGRVDEESTGYPCPIVFPKGEGIDFWRADDLEVVSTSPVVPNTVGEASCPGCSGTGWQGGNELFGACDDCGGSGKVSVEQKHGA